MSLSLTEQSFPGINPVYTGTNAYHWTTAEGRCLALPGAQARLFSVSINRALAGLVVYVYDGWSVNGTLVAKIDGSTNGLYNFGGVRTPNGIFIDVVGTGTFDVTANMESAEPRGGNLTLSGNEITDARRAAATEGDGLTTLPDSSMGAWEATTNSWTNGGFESNTTGWTGVGTVAATIVRDATHVKFGSQSLKVTTSGGATGEGVAMQTASKIAAVSGQTWTASWWLWAPAGATLNLQIFGYDAGNVNTADSFAKSIVGVGDWQRVSLTVTLAAGTTAGITSRISTMTAAQAISYWVDGVQMEQKSFATPYVETNGAAATRTASRVQMPITVINSTQGWVVGRIRADIDPSVMGAKSLWGANDGSSNNRLALVYNAGNWQTRRIASSVSGSAVSLADTWAAGDMRTAIFRWDAATVSLSVNGSAFSSASANNSNVVTITQAEIGGETGVASTPFGADFLWFACGTGALTDADAATINSWGSLDPLPSWFPTAASCTMVWHGNGTQYLTP